MHIQSKLPDLGTTIFTTMSALSNKHKAINLSQGFPDFDCSPDLQERVEYYLKNGKNQYAPMAGLVTLREKIKEKSQSLYGIDVNQDTEITITAGATQGIFTAIQAFVSKGDEAIIVEPAYDSYRPSLDLIGAKVKTYTLTSPNYDIDWKQFSQLINSRTRMIIINSPHNPTGSVLSQEDMKQLQELTKGTDIIVLSDEVYEHLIYDGQVHQSVLAYPELFERSIAVFSFGKTFHCTGWKIGYVIAPEMLMKEFRKVHQFNVFCVSSFVQYAIADYLEDQDTYLQLSSFFQQKRDFFAKAMIDSRFEPIPSRGSYFQLYDYNAISDLDDVEFAKRLTMDHGVATIPLTPFMQKPSMDKIVRFCFAKKEETLSAAAKRLQSVVRIQ